MHVFFLFTGSGPLVMPRTSAVATMIPARRRTRVRAKPVVVVLMVLLTVGGGGQIQPVMRRPPGRRRPGGVAAWQNEAVTTAPSDARITVRPVRPEDYDDGARL